MIKKKFKKMLSVKYDNPIFNKIIIRAVNLAIVLNLYTKI